MTKECVACGGKINLRKESYLVLQTQTRRKPVLEKQQETKVIGYLCWKCRNSSFHLRPRAKEMKIAKGQQTLEFEIGGGQDAITY